jgi:hypothetical protein
MMAPISASTFLIPGILNAHGASSYPSTTFKIWREYVRMVPEILDVLKDQAKAIKEAENSLQNKTGGTLFPGCPWRRKVPTC